MRSRCLRMSTGASRDTRAISPKTNSSATRSTSAVMETSQNDWTIFFQRSASFRCLVMNSKEGPAPWMEQPGATELVIVSRGALPSLGNRGQHRVERGVGTLQLHSHSDNVNGLQRLQMRTEIHCVLFRGNECRCSRLLAQALQLAHVRIACSDDDRESCAYRRARPAPLAIAQRNSPGGRCRRTRSMAPAFPAERCRGARARRAGSEGAVRQQMYRW